MQNASHTSITLVSKRIIVFYKSVYESHNRLHTKVTRTMPRYAIQALTIAKGFHLDKVTHIFITYDTTNDAGQ